MFAIKKNIVFAFIVISLISIAFSAFFALTALKERTEFNRVRANIESLASPLIYFYDKQGRIAANNNVILSKVSELKRQYPDIIKEIKNLKVAPGRTITYSGTVIESEKNIITLLKDSVITDTVKAKVFSYDDSWYKIHGIAIKDTQYVSIKSKDTIEQVVFKGKRRNPFLWILSKRSIEQKILSKNPNNKIIYNKTILITK